jgi:hypothetical protein
VAPAARLATFREDFYQCLKARTDTLFELTDAVLCADGPVTSLVELSPTAEHRRGHGALYDGLNWGDIDIARLRVTRAGLPLPRTNDGRIVLAVDVSNWLRPEAVTSPNRLFCHVYGRAKGQAQMIPGWPYSFVAALESGRTSWTAVLEAVRLGPADDATAVTATPLRDVVNRLSTAGHWRQRDPEILIVADTGYDTARLAYVLADLPVQLLGRSPPTGYCACPNRTACQVPPVGHPSTGPSSGWTPRPPGRHRSTRRPPPPAATAPP